MLAQLPGCTLYIVEILRAESRGFFAFEVQMVGRCMPTVSSSIAKVWSVKDKHALQGPHSQDRAGYITISFERYTVSQDVLNFLFRSFLLMCHFFWKPRGDQTENHSTKSVTRTQQKHCQNGLHFQRKISQTWARSLHAARFGHQMDRDQDLVPSSLRTFDFQHWKQGLQLGRDASGGWFVSGYVRLLQSQYESKSARTVLKITGQNLADYF